jgi:hypothetical protein
MARGPLAQHLRHAPANTSSTLSCACCTLGAHSLENQLAFSAALMRDWCGVAPPGSSEAALRTLLQ